MKVSYDPKTDILAIILVKNAEIHESDEDKPGVILDYDEKGSLVSIEILDASKKMPDINKMEFELLSTAA